MCTELWGHLPFLYSFDCRKELRLHVLKPSQETKMDRKIPGDSMQPGFSGSQGINGLEQKNKTVLNWRVSRSGYRGFNSLTDIECTISGVTTIESSYRRDWILFL